MRCQLLLATLGSRIYMSFCLAHSGQMISVASVMKPRPTSDVLQLAQMKQSLCQWRSSNDMKRVPPIPVWGERRLRDAMSYTVSIVLTSDWLDASCTSFGKQLPEAFSAIWLLISTGETLPSQRGRTVGASETLTMPWLVLVGYTSRCYNLCRGESIVNDQLRVALTVNGHSPDCI